MLRLAVVDAIGIFIDVMTYLMLANIIFSWIPPLRNSTLGRLVGSLVDPLLNPIRRLIYKSPIGGSGMMLDFSPAIALFLIQIAGSFLQTMILSL